MFPSSLDDPAGAMFPTSHLTLRYSTTMLRSTPAHVLLQERTCSGLATYCLLVDRLHLRLQEAAGQVL